MSSDDAEYLQRYVELCERYLANIITLDVAQAELEVNFPLLEFLKLKLWVIA